MNTDFFGLSEDIVLIIQFVAFIICLGVSACFSGSETALTSMSKLRVKRLFGENEELYHKMEIWLKEPNRFLATILIGNNFVNTLSAVLAANICEHILKHWFDISNPYAFGSALAVGFTTFIASRFRRNSTENIQQGTRRIRVSARHRSVGFNVQNPAAVHWLLCIHIQSFHPLGRRPQDQGSTAVDRRRRAYVD